MLARNTDGLDATICDPESNAGHYQTEQLEAGVKYDRGNFGGTLSLFNVTRPFGIFEPFDDPLAVRARS